MLLRFFKDACGYIESICFIVIFSYCTAVVPCLGIGKLIGKRAYKLLSSTLGNTPPPAAVTRNRPGSFATRDGSFIRAPFEY